MKILNFLPLLVIFSCGAETTTEIENDTINKTSDSIVGINIDSIELITVPAGIDYFEFEELAFGFADMDGDSVIITAKPDGIKGEDYDFGFTSKGRIDLKFLKSQKASSEDNGRQTAYNFKNLKGELFSVKNTTAPIWEAILFTSKEFMLNRKQLKESTLYDSQELSKQEIQTIESDKNWTISKTSRMSSYKEGSLYFIEFEKKKDSVMVSIVWVSEDGNCYLDFPAEYNEMSTWRVDDGGVFDLDFFKIITIFEGQQGIEILTDWIGAEGSSVNYYLGHNGIFEPVANAYFYSAPL